MYIPPKKNNQEYYELIKLHSGACLDLQTKEKTVEVGKIVNNNDIFKEKCVHFMNKED